MAEETKNENVETQNEQVDTQTEVETFTQEQVDKMIQKRLAKETKRHELEIQVAVDNALKERDRQSKLSEADKAKEESEQKDQRIVELEKQLLRNQLEREATAKLAEYGLTGIDEVLNFVIGEDSETTETAVDTFAALVNNLADEKAKKMLAGKTPQRFDGGAKTITKEDFNKMTVTQKSQLYTENRELFNQLSN